MCETPLFYLSQSVSVGKPTKDCVTSVVDEIAGNMGAAAVTGITGLLLLIASVGAFPLCSGKSDKDDMMNEEDK